MKILLKVLSLSVFIFLLPVAVYSVVSNLIKNDTPSIASKYDFIASAEFGDPGGGAQGAACESVGGGSCCESGGGGGGGGK